MMVSSRLSRCTRTPVGRTPMMATSAKAMTPRQRAISTIVKAAFLPLARPLGVIGSPAGFDFSGANVMEISIELRTGRLIHAGATGQPVDANEVVRVIQRRIKLVRRNENALRQALPFGKVPRVPPPRLVPDGPRCQ